MPSMNEEGMQIVKQKDEKKKSHFDLRFWPRLSWFDRTPTADSICKDLQSKIVC